MNITFAPEIDPERTKSDIQSARTAVRILSPIDTRKLLGLGQDCGVLLGSIGAALYVFTGRSWWSASPSPIERIQTSGRPSPYPQIRMRLVPAANALGDWPWQSG